MIHNTLPQTVFTFSSSWLTPPWYDPSVNVFVLLISNCFYFYGTVACKRRHNVLHVYNNNLTVFFIQRDFFIKFRDLTYKYILSISLLSNINSINILFSVTAMFGGRCSNSVITSHYSFRVDSICGSLCLQQTVCVTHCAFSRQCAWLTVLSVDSVRDSLCLQQTVCLAHCAFSRQRIWFLLSCIFRIWRHVWLSLDALQTIASSIGTNCTHTVNYPAEAYITVIIYIIHLQFSKSILL